MNWTQPHRKRPFASKGDRRKKGKRKKKRKRRRLRKRKRRPLQSGPCSQDHDHHFRDSEVEHSHLT
jgi:hypothetical protein